MSDSTMYPCLDVVDLGGVKTQETVEHPSHYHAQSGIEVIDAIEAWDLNFALGNAVKYIARAGHKDPARQIEDLKKAQWYVAREIERLTAPDDAPMPPVKLSTLDGEWS